MANLRLSPPFLLLALCGSPAWAEETRCDGTLGPSTFDNIRVPDGADCTLQGSRAKGTVKVGNGATLRAADVSVNGNLQAEGARHVQVEGRSRFGGSVQLKQGGGARVHGAHIAGDLQLDDNRGALSASGNRIGGNLQAVGNRRGVQVERNVIDGNLQCKENRPAPRGGGNRAASKEDQCAGL